MNKVTISTLKFEKVHGRRPTGEGLWVFHNLQDPNDVLRVVGSYSHARSEVRRHFSAKNVSFVVLEP